MTTSDDLKQRIEAIETGYEFMLAYAAQGLQDDIGKLVDAPGLVKQMTLDLRSKLVNLGTPVANKGAGTDREELVRAGENANTRQNVLGALMIRHAFRMKMSSWTCRRHRLSDFRSGSSAFS